LYDPPGREIPNVAPIGFGKSNEFSGFGNSSLVL
jgi:hypothetical protein